MSIDCRLLLREPFAKSSRRSRLIWTAALLLSFLLVGLNIYQDYGIPWDEPRQRNTGMTSLKYLGERFAPDLVAQDEELRKGRRSLARYRDRDYGVAFETPLVLIERIRGLSDPRDIYLFRHLATFVCCFFGVLAVFRLAERRFADWRLGALGSLFLVLSPRLFADFFYNSKDAVFMAAFAIAMSTSVRFLLRPTATSAFLHAVATGIAIDVRVVGIVLPAATAAFFLLRLARAEVPRPTVSTLALYLGLTAGTVVALWPYLWAAPWSNFVEAVENMSRFRWKERVLYQGALVAASDLPWHYVPVWITISTPIPYLVLFVAGTMAILAQLVRRRWRLWQNETELQDLLFLSLAVVPVASVIVLNSVLYDGWRQLYFIYPAFVLVSLRGWVALLGWRPGKLRSGWLGVVALGTALSLAHVGHWMARAHPYQNLYFNALAGPDPKMRFDADYWGLTNREALEFIVSHDKRPSINVWPGSWTRLADSTLMLRASDRVRVRVVPDQADADYIVTNYRGDQRDYASENPEFRLFHQVTVDGHVVNATYMRLKPRFPRP